MQTSGDSPVPGADVSLVPQLDPRLLEVCHIALLVLTHLCNEQHLHVGPVAVHKRIGAGSLTE